MTTSPEMDKAVLDAIINNGVPGQLAWDAIRNSKLIPDEKIVLPVRIEDLEYWASKMADEIVLTTELHQFVATVARIYLARLMNGQG